MKEIPTIIQDKREIQMLNGDGYTIAQLGRDGITTIKPYQEYGEMAMVTWFAVYVGDAIYFRVPARACHVVYEIGKDS